MKILIADKIADTGVELLKEEKEFVVDFLPKITKEELIDKIKEYNALIVRSRTKVTKEVIEAAPNLKIIARAGEGVDNIDMDAATEKGIIVMNTPGINTIAACEHTISLMLALSRNIPTANLSVKQNKWEPSKFIGTELYNKTVGVIGLGKIGKEVCKRLISFNMKILAYDPFISEEVAKGLNVKLVELPELLRQADYITIHAPLSKETHHLLSDEEFNLMKKGVRIINCARGGIIDEKALYKALIEGKVAGAALDVYEQEPPPADSEVYSELLKLDNVITTPHLGASTEEAQSKIGVEIALQVIDALKGKGIRNAVNLPSMDEETYKRTRPYIELAEKLGSFVAQLIKGRVTKVEIDYSGEVLDYNTTFLTNALLKGFLESILKESISFVNALLLSRNRGIEVIETKTTEIEAYTNLLTVKVFTKASELFAEQIEKVASATIFGKNRPRIVKLDDFYIEVEPKGALLIVASIDLPGVIGKIGSILGSHKINIAALSYARKEIGGDAISVLNIDAMVEKKIINELSKVNEIKNVTVVNL